MLATFVVAYYRIIANTMQTMDRMMVLMLMLTTNLNKKK
jgi:hypothetical protein